MIESFRNIFAIPDLRKRLAFTFALLAVYRLGCYVPTPGIDPQALIELMDSLKGTVLGFVNTFTGGSLERVAVFALGIMPYITASIILQLLTVVVPYLEKLSKEGELGRKKITQYTRYGTVVISIVQSMGIALFLENTPDPRRRLAGAQPGLGLPLHDGALAHHGLRLRDVAGRADQRARHRQRHLADHLRRHRGRPAAGVAVGLPAGPVRQPSRSSRWRCWSSSWCWWSPSSSGWSGRNAEYRCNTPSGWWDAACTAARAPTCRCALNTGGVIPVIFASSVVTIPQTIARMINVDWLQTVADNLQWGQPIYYLLYVTAIIFFSYFYVSIIFNPADLAENMRKYGGFIPGIRSGRRTAEYIDRILTRLTVIGALYLAAVSVLPEFLITGFKVEGIPFVGPSLDAVMPSWITQGLGLNFFFGGTSLLIVVGVAMDTLQQIESQLVMRNYDGFMKRGRIRGRRG